MRPYDVMKWIMGLTGSWPILKTSPFTDWQNDLHLIIGTSLGHFLVHILLAPAKIGAVMFTAAFHTSRHFILFTAIACLCVLLGGPSYAAGAESLIIAGATYYEPGVSGPGWAWTDADHLELNGFSGKAIGADGDLVVTLTGQNSVKEMKTSIVDISQCGLEVWGNLTLRGTGSLTATGSQCGIHSFQALVVDGCTVNAQADGDGLEDEVVAGLVAGRLVVRGGGRVVAAGAGSGAGVQAYGAYLLDEDPGDGVPFRTLAVDASWLDATGADGGVGCLAGSLTTARFVVPAGGAFGARGVVDAGGAVATHVVIEPEGATKPAGETSGRDVPGGGAGEPAGSVDPTAGKPGDDTSTDPAVKPATTSPKTSATTKKTVIKTTVATSSRPKTATGTTAKLPKTGDNNWIAASLTLLLLGTALLAVAYSCRGGATHSAAIRELCRSFKGNAFGKGALLLCACILKCKDQGGSHALELRSTL